MVIPLLRSGRSPSIRAVNPKLLQGRQEEKEARDEPVPSTGLGREERYVRTPRDVPNKAFLIVFCLLCGLDMHAFPNRFGRAEAGLRNEPGSKMPAWLHLRFYKGCPKSLSFHHPPRIPRASGFLDDAIAMDRSSNRRSAGGPDCPGAEPFEMFSELWILTFTMCIAVHIRFVSPLWRSAYINLMNLDISSWWSSCCSHTHRALGGPFSVN